jgi:hypothetical protein
MIAFNLKCKLEHVFEAWFKNSLSFEQQLEEKVISCVICGDRHLEVVEQNSLKEMSLENIPLEESEIKGISAEYNNEETQAVLPVVARGEFVTHCAHMPETGEITAEDVKRAMDHMYQTMAKFSRQVEKDSTYVGTDFAKQVREMKKGERPQSAIYGEVSMEETEELLEEGIDLLPVPSLGKLDS